MMKVLILILFSFQLVGQTMVLGSTDYDAIRNQLSTSLVAYDAASIGDWVTITSGEYSNLKNNLSGVSEIGSWPGSEYRDVGGTGQTMLNSNSLRSANNYLYAFKFDAYGTSMNLKVKTSTSETTGFAQLGNTLTITNSSGEIIYVVLKRGETTGSATYYGVYQSTGYRYTFSGGAMYWEYGDVADIPNTYAGIRLMWLTTTTKQW